jgi:hypothetical protein
MSTCTICASLLHANILPEQHSALRRQSVRQRFFDVVERYNCVSRDTHWKHIILAEDKYPVRYRWRLAAEAMQPASQMSSTVGGDLDHAGVLRLSFPHPP